MNGSGEPVPVAVDESLARYLLQSSHIRADLTVRPDAFIPYPWPDLSVTRHLGLTQEQIWAMGDQVTRQIGKTLHGRADVLASAFISRRLQVRPAPVADNSNHANVTGWPADKPSQKILAQEIAADAGQALRPPEILGSTRLPD